MGRLRDGFLRLIGPLFQCFFQSDFVNPRHFTYAGSDVVMSPRSVCSETATRADVAIRAKRVKNTNGGSQMAPVRSNEYTTHPTKLDYPVRCLLLCDILGDKGYRIYVMMMLSTSKPEAYERLGLVIYYDPNEEKLHWFRQAPAEKVTVV